MTTPGETAVPVEPSAPPDWATVTQDILCPLCDYNLRGLVEPRCPECGHRTNWKELTDPDLRRHPWLYEDRRGKPIRNFIHTLLVSQLPHRFWKSVRPTVSPKLGQLWIYWIVVISIVALTSLASPGVTSAYSFYQIYRWRAEAAASLAHMPPYPAGMTPATIRQIQALGVQGFIDRQLPYSLATSRMFGTPNRRISQSQQLALICVGICYMLWPWLTVGALLLFRQTLRHAKIKTSHIVRCAVYSADAGVFLAVPAASYLIWCYQSMGYGVVAFDGSSMLVLAICAGTLTYRLCVAYRRYLGLPQAIATALLSQCVVLLAMVVAYVQIVPVWGF